MVERLAANARAAAAVFMTDDARAARRLLGEKEVFRDLEARATEAHFARVRAGRVESVETSALHLDLLRDAKRINAHLAAAAYPVLERLGELLPSRLRREAERRALTRARPRYSAAAGCSTISRPSSSTERPVRRAASITLGCQSTLPGSGPPTSAISVASGSSPALRKPR